MGYEFFYKGGDFDSSLEPYSDSLFTGYRFSANQIGMTTDPRTANQISEISSKISTGGKTFEVSTVSPQILDSIPKQHLKEIQRLSKITGVETTMHGPLIELSGYTQQGWNEAARKQAENQMLNSVQRAHELNSEGNIPITFHSSCILPEGEERIKYSVKGEKPSEELESFYVVNKETGEILPLRKKEKFFPGQKEEKFKVENEIERLNKDFWTTQLHTLSNNYKISGADKIKEIIQEEPESSFLEQYSKYSKQGGIPRQLPDSEEKRKIEKQFKEMYQTSLFLRQTYNGLREMFNSASRNKQNLSEGDKKRLENYALKASKLVHWSIEENPEKIIEFSGLIEEGIKVLSSIKPSIFQSLDEFTITKSSETIANVALESYKKYKNKSPIISIENPPAGSGLSRGEDLRKLVDTARNKFVEKAKEKGFSGSEAKKIAERLIGVTWDVGHINMLRKKGYSKEDIVKETEKVAQLVKHVHLSDNFGMEHTELPMGMGNVPIKEILEKLGQEGFEGKKIIEAAQWFEHFKSTPFPQTLGAFGSYLHSYAGGASWDQIESRYGSYSSGQGKILPEQHFSLYGSGFTSLPVDLGGQIPEKKSRVTGTPID